MNQAQIELGRHTLGLPNKQRTSYRNHFVAGRGHSDYADWLVIVAEGYATQRKGNELTGHDDLFWLTRAGALLCLKHGERLSKEDFPVTT